MRGELESEMCLACIREEMYQSCVGDRYSESGDIFSDVYVNRFNQYQPAPARRMQFKLQEKCWLRYLREHLHISKLKVQARIMPHCGECLQWQPKSFSS